MTSDIFTTVRQVLNIVESGAVTKELPILKADAVAVCDDAIAAGKALTNLGTSTKKLLTDATPVIAAIQKVGAG